MKLIVIPGLQFSRSHTKRNVTDYHVLHHADYPWWVPGYSPNLGAVEIGVWHRNRKPPFYGVGYNTVIPSDASVQEGRPHWAIGAHSGPSGNSRGLGTCIVGRCTPSDHPTRPGRRPTDAQIEAAIKLHWEYEKIYAKKILVVGHNHFMATECPGPLFPLDEIRREVSRPGKAQKPPLTLLVNGKSTGMDIRLANGRTEVSLSGSWVQVRDLANFLGAEIGWDEPTQKVDLIVK